MGSVPCPCTSSSWEKGAGVTGSITADTCLEWRILTFHSYTISTVGLWESSWPAFSTDRDSLVQSWSLGCLYASPTGTRYLVSQQPFTRLPIPCQPGPSLG